MLKTRSPIGAADESTSLQRTVLVMDDDAATRQLLAELLAGEGYGVLEAADGEYGLRLARQLDPQVILLDLRLPPTSGLDVLDALRAGAATRHIPVVVVSGQPLPSEEGRNPGPEGVIRKPFDIRDLLAHVERMAALGEEH